MRKTLSLLIALVLCLNLALPALAEETVTDETIQQTTATEAVNQEEIDEANDQEVTEEEAISIIIYDLEEEISTETPTNPVSAGVFPDSPLYFLDKLIESLQLALAKTPEAKAALLTSFSQERLAEIEALDPEKLDQYIDGLLSEISAALQQAADAVTTAHEKGVEIAKLVQILEQAAQQGNNVELPEAIRKADKIEEYQGEIETTTKAIKVQAAVVKGIDKEIIIELRTKGLGYGQIALLTKLASTLSVEVKDEDQAEEAVVGDTRLAQVMKKFAENKSIGQTMKAFNTTPGQVKKEANKNWLVKDSKDDDDEDDDDNDREKKWSSKSKSKGQSKSKGKGK